LGIAPLAIEQLPPDTPLVGGREVAAVGLARDELDERTSLEWHRGEDDLASIRR
jgi:hypothetical protein